MFREFKNFKFQISSLIEYGFCLLLFFLPWQTQLILRPGLYKENQPVDYWTIGLFGTDILLVALLILFFANKIFKEKNSISKNFLGFQLPFPGRIILLVILSCLELAAFISVFFAPDKILAAYRYGIFLLGIGLFWLVVKMPFDKKKAAGAFLAGLFLSGILALHQFFTQSTFAEKWLGLAEHQAAKPGSSVVETSGADGTAERWLRTYGSFPHPNILGGVMAVGLIFLIFAIINNQRENKKTNYKVIIYYLLFIVLFSALLLSFSRAAWLSFAAGFFIFASFNFFKKNWPALKRLGGIIFLAAAVFGVIFFNYQNLFITRAGGAERLEIKSISERRMYLEDAEKMLKENWVKPRGLGNYTVVLAEEKESSPWYYFQPVHNVFLLIWAEIGFAGLLFFLFFLAYLFWQSLKNKNILGLSVLSMSCIIMALDHWLWSLHFGVIFFWLIAGIIIKNNYTKLYEIKS